MMMALVVIRMYVVSHDLFRMWVAALDYDRLYIKRNLQGIYWSIFLDYQTKRTRYQGHRKRDSN